jgi:hypothetical protein
MPNAKPDRGVTTESEWAREDILIGTQVAVDLDNGTAPDGVVAAAKRAWGFNFVAPPFIISTALLEKPVLTLCVVCMALEHARPGAQLPISRPSAVLRNTKRTQSWPNSPSLPRLPNKSRRRRGHEPENQHGLHGQCGATRGPLIPFAPCRRKCNLSKCHFGKDPNVDPGADPETARQSISSPIIQPRNPSVRPPATNLSSPKITPFVSSDRPSPAFLICIVEPAGGACTDVRCLLPSSGDPFSGGDKKLGI